MWYTKKDLNMLRKQAEDKNLGFSVRQYYKSCIAEIESNGKVDTTKVRRDGDDK